MPNLLQSLFRRDATTQRYDGADYAGLDPLDFSFSFGGTTYTGMPGQAGAQSERIESNFIGMVQGAYKRNGIIFACMRARLGVFSDGRFQFQRLRNGRPGDMFGDASLSLLEAPWPNGTTGDLLTRTLQDGDLAGNAFWTIRNGFLRRMRPDWVTIVMGSQSDPDMLPDDLDAELLGYGYFPGGYMSNREPVFLLPGDVAHFAPTPDPIAHYRGMSWLTPVIREIQADTAATIHKLAFFENGATLQTIVSFKDMKQEVFEAFRKKMDLAHKGAQNAYKTLYLGGGADATVVGADLKQLDFKVTQGAGESRIAAAAGVHPVIVGLSEGLQGSSLNAGNFGQARRLFSEGTLNTLWRNVSASLATLVPAPPGAQLVIDKRDIPFLREDAKDAVEIQQNMASTIVSLATGGFTRDSAIAAVTAQDMTLLVEDPNWVSVQLQQSGGQPPAPTAGGPPVGGDPKAPAATAARAFNPNEPRDPLTGEWGIGGAVGGALKDTLKLAGKIDLDRDEKLVGSGKVDGALGGIRMALTVTHGAKSLRLGLGGEGYGKPDRDEGIPAWDGNASRPPLSKADEQRLTAEREALDQEYDSATPARQAEIDAKLAGIREQLTAGDGTFNGTAKLDQYSMERLVGKIRPALAEAAQQEKTENAAYEEYEALQAKGTPDPARMAELRRIARLDSSDSITFAKGIAPGSAWGDVHYEVGLDDLDTGTYVVLGVQPKNAPDDWGAGKDWTGQFDRADTKKFLNLFTKYAAS